MDIPPVETRHSVGGSFGRELSAFVIVAELKRPEVAIRGNFLAIFGFFLEKTTPYGKICKNSFPKVYMSAPIDIAILKCKIFPTGNRRNRALFTSQKISAPCQIVGTVRIAPKISQGQPQTFGSDFIQIGPLSAEL